MRDEGVFIDTNVLIYAYEKGGSEKHAECRKIVEACFRGEKEYFISNQVIAEFSSVMLSKLDEPLPLQDVKEIVEEFNRTNSWKKINYDGKTVEKALANNSSFWDSLIAETMKENGISRIYTENTRDFEKIAGLSPVNPLNKRNAIRK